MLSIKYEIIQLLFPFLLVIVLKNKNHSVLTALPCSHWPTLLYLHASTAWLACCGFSLPAIFRYDVVRGLRAAAAPLLGPPIRLCSVLVWLRHSFCHCRRVSSILQYMLKAS